ncbi:MAG TPA: DegT/DnrJ/EryC1/StrS family aminotransferase [Chthoniobacteraceae bacterium]|nr:DegT/DnrJ/EryC1/StrS family aminotransferase [Chthoniobacteraceae bacterium]
MLKLAETEMTKTLRARPQLGLGIRLVGREEEELLLEVVRSKQLFRYSYGLPPAEQGRMTATLEREICEKMGVRHALAVTSGTAALEVALAALEVGPGDEVILPAWSWVSCFTAIVRLGALPVLAEIDETFCLAPGEITRLRTPRTKAVLVVHYQGVAADMDPLLEEARQARLPILEDCAQAAGASYHGRRVGSMGAIGIYSFQHQKSMSSGEGGMVVTSDPLLYERAVRLHDLGFLRPYHTTLIEPQLDPFCGAQYRMNELTGAVALAQLRKLDGIRAHCRRLSGRILATIGSLPGLEFRRIPDPQGDSGIEIYLRLATPEQARAFRQELDARNINCTKTTGTYCHYAQGYCISRATYLPAASPFRHFAEWPAKGYRAEDFPRTEELIRRFVSLPVGILYTDEDADYMAESIVEVHRRLSV